MTFNLDLMSIDDFFSKFISLIPFLSMIILKLGCSKKPAEKEAYEFDCKGSDQMGNK